MTATVLALALVWRDADVSAVGNFEMPYQVTAMEENGLVAEETSDVWENGPAFFQSSQ